MSFVIFSIETDDDLPLPVVFLPNNPESLGKAAQLLSRRHCGLAVRDVVIQQLGSHSGATGMLRHRVEYLYNLTVGGIDTRRVSYFEMIERVVEFGEVLDL